MKRPRDLERKAITEIGHGVRALHYYNYGPTYTGASDADSEKTDKYPFLQRANFAIGAVERYLVNARVPPSRVALHYSHASDIWTAAAPENPHGKERMYLYLLLRHLGYPVEVLTEEEIAAGALRACDFLVVLGPHVQRSAQSAMVDWVNAGGFLYLGPGSGRFDEFNQPADLGQQFGIGRGPFRETQPVGRAEFELAKRTPLDTVRFMDDDLAVLCVRQSLGLSNPPAAEVVARFRDGQPALLVRRAGKGKVAASGFFVGVGYAQGAAAARQARWNHERQTGTERASYAPPSFPSGYRALFATLLRQIDYRPPVRSSEPLVEANLLRAPDADVIALVNWSAQPVTNLAVTVATGSASGQPTAVINQLKATRAAAGETTVVLDLPTIDYLVFPTRPSSPPARDKDR